MPPDPIGGVEIERRTIEVPVTEERVRVAEQVSGTVRREEVRVTEVVADEGAGGGRG